MGLPPLQLATLKWLFFGYSVIWIGIVLFLLNMGRRQERLEQQIESLEQARRR